RRPRRGTARARTRAAPGRQARRARDHAPAGPAEAVLPALVRRARAVRGPRPPRREGVHLPARERSPLSRPRRPLGAARARGLRRGALPAARGRQRRAPRGDSAVNADAVLHEASPYLVELEERLAAAVERYPGL